MSIKASILGTEDEQFGHFRQHSNGIYDAGHARFVAGVTADEDAIQNAVDTAEEEGVPIVVVPEEMWPYEKNEVDVPSSVEVIREGHSPATAVTEHEGEIDHDALDGYRAVEHVDHSTVSIIAGNALEGGGDLTADRTLGVVTDGIQLDELDLSISPTWTGVHTFSTPPVVIGPDPGGSAQLRVGDDTDAANLVIARLGGLRPTPTVGDTAVVEKVLANDAGNPVQYAQVRWRAETITAGAEDGALIFDVQQGGSLEEAAIFDAAEILFNANQSDRDFKVHTAGSLNALIVSGSDGRVGIGLGSPAAPSEQLDVDGNIAVTGTVDGVDVSVHAADVDAHHARYTGEEVDDRVAALLVGGTNITLTYDDAADSLTIDAAAASSPGGTDGEVQYNNGGSFGGASTLHWDDGNSRLGVGTSSPGAPLHVSGSVQVSRDTNDDLLRLNGAAGNYRYISYQSGGTDRWFVGMNNDSESGSDAGSNFIIRARADDGSFLSDALFIERSSQNVGIGTTSPSKTLHVSGPGDAIPMMISTEGGGGGKPGIEFEDPTAADFGGRLYFDDDSSTMRLVGLQSGTEHLGIVVQRADGNVGIGIASPVDALHVVGEIRADGPRVTARRQDNNRYGYFEGRRSDGLRGFYLGYGNGGSYVDLRLDNASDLYISGGNVGIGTSSPGVALEVNGTVTTGSIHPTNDITFQSIDLGVYGTFSPNRYIPQHDNLSVGGSNHGVLSAANNLYYSADANNNPAAKHSFGFGTVDPGDADWFQVFEIFESGNVQVSDGDFYVRNGNFGIGTASPDELLHVLDGHAVFGGDAGSTGAALAQLQFDWAGTQMARIEAIAGDDITNKNEGDLGFYTGNNGTLAEKLRVHSAGATTVLVDTPPAGPDLNGAVRNIKHHGTNSPSSVGVEGTLHTQRV